VKRDVRVMVTIDTEEDDWGSYGATGASVENIQQLPELTELWDRFGARPTYFVNYPPMVSPEASEVLQGLAAGGGCEMGVHCHPWNTPPLEPLPVTDDDPPSMMSRLSEVENEAKLRVLTERFKDLFGTRPRVFRAGRWGFGPSVAGPLHRLGYEADFSVSPYTDWSDIGGPDYSRVSPFPYRFEPSEPFVPSRAGALVEIPTSIGHLRGPQRLSGQVRGALERSILAKMKVVGLLDSLGLVARRWISPENTSSGDMKKLASTLTRKGHKVLDVTFHSPTLVPGLTPFVKTEADRRRFLRRIEEFLEFCSEEGFRFATAGEVATAVRGGELAN